MMDNLIGIIKDATAEEVTAAGNRYGELHSRNEGYGVLAEEIDEMKEQISIVMRYFDSLVRVIRFDLRELNADLKNIKKSAQLAACECIQVAAVAQRFIDLVDGRDGG